MSSIHQSAQAKMICDAIKHKRRLSFYYHDKERIGEPQCCGVSTAGKEVVRMRLVKGGSRPEQLFEIALITSLTPLNDHFACLAPITNEMIQLCERYIANCKFCRRW